MILYPAIDLKDGRCVRLLHGDMDQAISIRTLVFHGDSYSYQAGGGIVADSSPQAEYAELMAKSAVLRRALELAAEGL